MALSYLSNEDDLGVLLVGLDALHSLLELFSASEVFGPLLVHFLPVIRQLDGQLAMAAAEGTEPELAALWLLSPLRLAKLYQLRCAANLGTCAESKQAGIKRLSSLNLVFNRSADGWPIRRHWQLTTINSWLRFANIYLRMPAQLKCHCFLDCWSSLNP